MCNRIRFVSMASIVGAMSATAAYGQNWVTMQNETSARFSADPGISTTDPEEKRFAQGDFDHDGDIDLAVARKQPFTTSGRKRQVLFMNEDGVLVDRTNEFGTNADDGGEGMLDLTANRDMIATDVNQDTWLDLVTAPTYGQGLPKTISHPRVYLNLGDDENGDWQGFQYQEARTPTFGCAPNFCHVGAGDVTGDGFPDLYFVDYDNVTASTCLDDRLLINDGTGFFTDETTQRMPSSMTESGFGIASNIFDINGDGWNDIIKNQAGGSNIFYNDGAGEFTLNQSVPPGGSNYFIQVGELNNDGMLDLIISDDGSDRYNINQGPVGSGSVNWVSFTFPDSGGFNGDSAVADMNNDGWNDVVITDADVDVPGCGGPTRMYRNLGNAPNVTMAFQGNGGIASGSMTGNHDIAIFDLDSDGWNDIILGRCAGLQIWMNQPPIGVVFSYPLGLPAFIDINKEFNFEVKVVSTGEGALVPDTGLLYYSINGSAFVSTTMQYIGPDGDGDLYAASLPAVECTDSINFYVSVDLDNGDTFLDPANAPNGSYQAIAAEGTVVALDETFEGDTTSWSVESAPALSSGAWQAVVPIGSINGTSLAAPDQDAGAGDDVVAFVTQNGLAGGGASTADVDGGPTYLTSPIFDLTGSDAIFSWRQWFYTATGALDSLRAEISNDGGLTWTLALSSGNTSGWQTASFRVSDFVEPNDQVRVRFWTQDLPNDSVTEAGIDNFQIEELVCGTPCPADIAPTGSPDGSVGAGDLGELLANWGDCPAKGPCLADIAPAGAPDGIVGAADLGELLANWGQCQ